MRRLLFTLSLVLTAMMAYAVPAKPGTWQTFRTTDGTEIRVQLKGDEHIHFWQTADGQRYTVDDDGTARPADIAKMRQHALSRRAEAVAHVSTASNKRLRSPRHVTTGEKTHYRGKKKGIVILMQFTDTKFKEENDPAKYNDILNKENYVTKPFKGSVADYFRAQSNGLFEIQFDVVGPYTAKHDVQYYGRNNDEGDDLAPDQLIVEAVTAADNEVNFQDYDWDGDGQADEVYVIYAGKGEADGGGSRTIWPHMWWLKETGMEQTRDNVLINTYACSNELKGNNTIEGIGNVCHEFSHCLGFPDFYDIMYNGWFGMSDFDLMNSGCYNENAFLPAGYSAYEKWMAGWMEPEVLADKDVKAENIKAISENGQAYVIYNSGWQDEYYIVENRQLTRWDAGLPGKGLMITHVDFDEEIWAQNTPNTRITEEDVEKDKDYTKTNDHQRFTIFHADNDDDAQYWRSYNGYYTKKTLKNDLYPCENNNCLTATSEPAATLYNKNKRGKYVMEGGIIDIKQNSDGTMSFTYCAEINDADTTKTAEAIDDILFKGTNTKHKAVYTIDGRYAGEGLNGLPRGIYIVGGRKFVK